VSVLALALAAELGRESETVLEWELAGPSALR